MFNPQTYYTEDGEYVFSVSELNLNAKEVLEDHFQTILVMGEVSNFSRPASGHIYFSLKDETAHIRCAWFRGRQSPLAFNLENGTHIIVMADVTLYPDRGEYQLVVRRIQLAGEGLIKQKLEALKRKLQQEGLFNPEHKQILPVFPRKVGVITSQTGAALQDVLTILKRRAPFIEVYVYPCQVQGTGAADTIIRALNIAIVDRHVDALMLTRGGGSNEDLYVFNDEKLAYAIFNCPIPIVSAVGHEVDLTIADFVADLRAPTPSAAAELLSPYPIEELFSFLRSAQERINQSFKRVLDEKIKKLVLFSRFLIHPARKVKIQQELLQQAHKKLIEIIHNLITSQKVKLNFTSMLIEKNNPRQKILNLQRDLHEDRKAIIESLAKNLTHKKYEFLMAIEKLETLSPINTLKRGYAILYTDKNNVLLDVKHTQIGKKISAHLTNGKLICKVEKIII